LIVVAGLLSDSITARGVDSAVGIMLIVIGFLLRRKKNKHRLIAPLAPVLEEHRMPEAEER
jgi:hypothetical protein